MPKIHPLKIDFEIPVSTNFKLKRFVNVFVIEGEYLHLIDTGVAAGFQQIEAFVNSLGRKLESIKSVVLTHAHPDHIGGAKLLHDKTGCTIIAPGKKANWIENTELQFLERPVPGFQKLVAGPVNLSQKIVTNEYIRLEEDITLEAIPTPGHSVDSYSYCLRDIKSVFTGDAILLPGEIPIFENITEYLCSLNKIEQLKPSIIYSSWDTPRVQSEIESVLNKSKNYVLHIRKIVKEVAPDFKKNHNIDFCKEVLKKLGLDENLANPLLLKSFTACLE